MKARKKRLREKERYKEKKRKIDRERAKKCDISQISSLNTRRKISKNKKNIKVHLSFKSQSQLVRQINRWIYNLQINSQIDRQIDSWIFRYIDRFINRQLDIQIDRYLYRYIDGWIDRQMDIQRD